jgi:predicted transcriptional regulator
MLEKGEAHILSRKPLPYHREFHKIHKIKACSGTCTPFHLVFKAVVKYTKKKLRDVNMASTDFTKAFVMPPCSLVSCEA